MTIFQILIQSAMKNNFTTSKTVYLFLALLALVFVNNSCKKDSSISSNTYEMSFKANGTLVDYKTEGALVATFTNTDNQFLGVFSGYDANSNMGLQVYSDAAISEMSYSGYTTSGFVLVGVLMGYQDTSGTLYSQAGSDVVINISKITDTSVSGTFSGTLKASGKADMVITDGKFTVKRYN